MRKNLLFTLLALLIAGAGFSQNIVLSHIESGDPIENGEEFHVYGDPDDDFLIIEDIRVTNNSGATMQILCKKVEIYVVPTTFNTFCWGGQCYGPDTYVSGVYAELGTGEYADDFTGDLYPVGTTGVSTLHYVWFDQNNTTDTTYIIVKFSTSPIGIGDEFAADFISNPYPNPASNVFYIDVNAENHVAETQVVISNILGATVKTVDITGLTGKVSVNTAELESGLYLYSVIVNNKIVSSNKLVIQH